MLVAALLLVLNGGSPVVHADPIDPPEGYPKLSLSTKTVTPTLAHTGGATLRYFIEIRNTGAYTARNTTLTDVVPAGTSYNGDAQASTGATPSFANGTLTWEGNVGFDAVVIVDFSVTVDSALVDTVRNTAVISHPLISQPVAVMAEAVVTDQPILAIGKTSVPSKPGANKPLTYTIIVTNHGQPVENLLLTVTDQVPSNTAFGSASGNGSASPGGKVTWTRWVTLGLGETTTFTLSVDVDDVPSGTILTNAVYKVSSSASGVTTGEPYTVTVVDPSFLFSKSVWPDPPGSNREMTYTLTVLNVGSLATGLVITERMPEGVEYRRGGTESGGVVSWSLPSLDTSESANFTYTVYINDVVGVPIVNDDYIVCSDEDVCQSGDVLTSTVRGPFFEASVVLDPIAKKPGGGGGPVTPTLVVRNLGPGNALDATALLEFRRISVSANDLYAIPASGTLPPFPSVDCGEKCDSYLWMGNLSYGKAITFTTIEGQSTIGGDEGTIYTATVVISDSLGNSSTDPVTGTASGRITHLANLIPTKSAPTVIGRGQLMTYTIHVWNSGLSTDEPPLPWMEDVQPMSTTLVRVSDGGVADTSDGTLERSVISWTLPAMSTGSHIKRSFTVRVDDDLVSGTQIFNDDYRTYWYENDPTYTGILSNTGQPVTTTVREVGLVDSYKEVTPTLALPGPGNVLSYFLHIVNSSPLKLNGVTVYDLLPWQFSTYGRDAIASAGKVISDIVSVEWTGDLAPFSSEVVTLSVLVDPDYQGPITNTAIISHPSLLDEVTVRAVAYVTELPVLRIGKSASPDLARKDTELVYTIRVTNLGQQATSLVISDTVPSNVDYVAGGREDRGVVWWETPVLEPGEGHDVVFQVSVESGRRVVNSQYSVLCAEGVFAVGAPLVTPIASGSPFVYMPLLLKDGP